MATTSTSSAKCSTGDHFGILYETFEDERGETVKTGNGADGRNGWRGADKDILSLHAVGRWPVVDYFDATGQSAKKFLMKTPINGARLSSGFGNRKPSHPRLYQAAQRHRLRRPHRHAHLCGGQWPSCGLWSVLEPYGNYAKIQHANGYVTAYAHMSRYRVKGLQSSGSNVKQGQVIGYVGTTGRLDRPSPAL